MRYLGVDPFDGVAHSRHVIRQLVYAGIRSRRRGSRRSAANRKDGEDDEGPKRNQEGSRTYG